MRAAGAGWDSPDDCYGSSPYDNCEGDERCGECYNCAEDEAWARLVIDSHGNRVNEDGQIIQITPYPKNRAFDTGYIDGVSEEEDDRPLELKKGELEQDA